MGKRKSSNSDLMDMDKGQLIAERHDIHHRREMANAQKNKIAGHVAKMGARIDRINQLLADKCFEGVGLTDHAIVRFLERSDYPIDMDDVRSAMVTDGLREAIRRRQNVYHDPEKGIIYRIDPNKRLVVTVLDENMAMQEFDDVETE